MYVHKHCSTLILNDFVDHVHACALKTVCFCTQCFLAQRGQYIMYNTQCNVRNRQQQPAGATQPVSLIQQALCPLFLNNFTDTTDI